MYVYHRIYSGSSLVELLLPELFSQLIWGCCFARGCWSLPFKGFGVFALGKFGFWGSGRMCVCVRVLGLRMFGMSLLRFEVSHNNNNNDNKY